MGKKKCEICGVEMLESESEAIDICEYCLQDAEYSIDDWPIGS